jgi:biopolymer transport protein ExbD
MEKLSRAEGRRKIFSFKRKLENDAEEVQYLNITAMMDMMTILLVFMLKSWSVEVANIKISELEPPKSTIDIPLAAALKVEVTPTSIIVEGDGVVPVRNGAVNASYKKNGANDLLIVPLDNVVQKHAKREKHIAELRREEWKGEMSLIADKGTPYRVISEVLYTVGQAGYHNYRLVTVKPTEE